MSDWKIGNEFAPYHPDASHVEPGYRDGWNACYRMASDEIERLREDAERYRWLRQMIYDDRIIVAPDRMLHGDALDAAIDAALALADEAMGERAA